MAVSRGVAAARIWWRRAIGAEDRAARELERRGDRSRRPAPGAGDRPSPPVPAARRPRRCPRHRWRRSATPRWPSTSAAATASTSSACCGCPASRAAATGRRARRRGAQRHRARDARARPARAPGLPPAGRGHRGGDGCRGGALRAGVAPGGPDAAQIIELVRPVCRRRAVPAAGPRLRRPARGALPVPPDPVPALPILIGGVFDVIAREPGGLTLVVDYKTDRLDGADPPDAGRPAYGTQRLVYALAALRGGAERVEVVHTFLELPQRPAVARLHPRAGAGRSRPSSARWPAGCCAASSRSPRRLIAACATAARPRAGCARGRSR